MWPNVCPANTILRYACNSCVRLFSCKGYYNFHVIIYEWILDLPFKLLLLTRHWYRCGLKVRRLLEYYNFNTTIFHVFRPFNLLRNNIPNRMQVGAK